jgi:hypothetical protein
MSGVVCITDLGGAMAALGVLALILMFLVKLVNVLRVGGLYDWVHMFTTYMVSVFGFLFALLGLLTERTVLLTSYMMLSGALLTVITIFLFIEILLCFSKNDFRERLKTEHTRRN